MAPAAVKGDLTLAALAYRYDVRPNQITQWRTELLQQAAEVFATAAEKRETDSDIKTRRAWPEPVRHGPACPAGSVAAM